MENNFIKIDGALYNVSSIARIGDLHEHNKSQLYFRITYKNSTETIDVEYDYSDYLDSDSDTPWEEQVKMLTNKLENELNKLHNYLLTGEGNTKIFFQTISLKK